MNFTRMEEDLIRDEGLRLRPYKCSAGHLTIGVGHKIQSTDRIEETGSVSLELAGYLLTRDISKALGIANSIFGRERFDSMAEARQRAIVNMIFNLGEAGFLGFRRMVAAIKAEDWTKAAIECLDSKYARQVGDRAKRVAHAMRTGRDA